jgi:hypothetical protein
MPKRVQMHRRQGGWRKDHPDAVDVARPGKWGNPWSVEKAREVGYDGTDADLDTLCVRLFRNGIERGLPAVAAHRAAIESGELRGKDLACWCPLDQPCHADVLLELANREC